MVKLAFPSDSFKNHIVMMTQSVQGHLSEAWD